MLGPGVHRSNGQGPWSSSSSSIIIITLLLLITKELEGEDWYSGSNISAGKTNQNKQTNKQKSRLLACPCR